MEFLIALIAFALGWTTRGYIEERRQKHLMFIKQLASIDYGFPSNKKETPKKKRVTKTTKR